MIERGYTKTDPSYPGYINVKIKDGVAIVTVRADPFIDGGPYTRCGELVSLKIPEADFRAFMADLLAQEGNLPELKG